MAKPKKVRAPSAWSHPPKTAMAAEAIRQLAKTRKAQATLKKRAAMLAQIIIAAGGGEAYGYRASIAHTHAFRGMRLVTRKAGDKVILTPVSSLPDAEAL